MKHNEHAATIPATIARWITKLKEEGHFHEAELWVRAHSWISQLAGDTLSRVGHYDEPADTDEEEITNVIHLPKVN